ncbi:hypothetical protein L1987_18693 [Smallanthus sonchifolius]|uniref:Uncharacterized protein n=1 Tax=Smallanthus sonchifolius TaxID=185202 RepID=A0ACB9J3X4_9ASTR|nr:hypothetical protein L1987_18693 [Smallanthus sonchifolius]
MDFFGPISIRSIGGKSYCLDESVNTACHVLNRVLTVKRHNKTCYELLKNRKPNLEYLLPFGNPCTLLKVRDVPTKFSAKAIEGIFLGYVANSTTKRVYNKETRQSFQLPSDISPEEAVVLYDSYPNVASCSGTQESDSEKDNVIFQDSSACPLLVDEPSNSTQAQGEIPTNLDSEIPVNYDMSYQSDTTQVDVLLVPEVASIKEIKAHPITNIIGNLRDEVELKNVEMALRDNNWIEAMQEELAQFDKLKVWNLVDLSNGVYPIGTKWVFKCKKDNRGVVGFHSMDKNETIGVRNYQNASRIDRVRVMQVSAMNCLTSGDFDCFSGQCVSISKDFSLERSDSIEFAMLDFQKSTIRFREVSGMVTEVLHWIGVSNQAE